MYSSISYQLAITVFPHYSKYFDTKNKNVQNLSNCTNPFI